MKTSDATESDEPPTSSYRPCRCCLLPATYAHQGGQHLRLARAKSIPTKLTEKLNIKLACATGNVATQHPRAQPSTNDDCAPPACGRSHVQHARRPLPPRLLQAILGTLGSHGVSGRQAVTSQYAVLTSKNILSTSQRGSKGSKGSQGGGGVISPSVLTSSRAPKAPGESRFPLFWK